MVDKALISRFFDIQAQNNYRIDVEVSYIDTSNDTIQEVIGLDVYFDSPVNMADQASFVNAINTKILSYGSSQGYSALTNADVIWPSYTAKAFANPTRSLNSAFQISTSRDAAVSYSVDISTAISLTTGQTGTVYLRYADDSGFTTNVIEVCRFVNGNTGTLTIGLALTQNGTGTLSGVIPAGKYVKLVTENNTGTPTFTYRRAQEVLI